MGYGNCEIYQEWERKELIAGSSEGTIFERSEEVKAIKQSPTRANFDRFLYRHGWRSVNGNGICANYDSKIGMLRLFAEMYDPIFYGDNVKGQPLYYFDGVLDETGKLVAPLELRINLNQKYYE